MTIVGQAKVGQVAARLVERLARKFGKDESARVEAVVLITAVRHGEGERLTIHYDTSSGLALGEGIGVAPPRRYPDLPRQLPRSPAHRGSLIKPPLVGVGAR